MPENSYSTTQTGLQATRSQLAEEEKKLLIAREKFTSANEELDSLKRLIDSASPNPQLLERQSALEKLKEDAQSEIASAYKQIHSFRKEDQRLLMDLKQIGNPIGNLNDQTPILLFPLRMETRFVKLPDDRTQLWVRVYPDDCQVESFSEMLSESERKNAIAFWTGMWIAGKIEKEERAVWGKLVQSHGSGRAAWIIDQFKPINEGSHPNKLDAPSTVFLVIQNEVRLSQREEEAAAIFWKAYWMAGGDAKLWEKAFEKMKASDGMNEEKALNVLRNYVPHNIDNELLKAPTMEEDMVSVHFIHFPDRDTTNVSARSWNSAAKVRTLPERFSLIAYYKGDRRKEYPFEHLVPPSLDVGLDPSLPTSQIDTEAAKSDAEKAGDFKVSEELEWLTDFDVAVRNGMGTKITLDPDQLDGFDKLLVVGIRYSADAMEGASLVQRLMLNHQQSRNGFGLLPQGTPTNNTEDSPSGYSWIDNPDATYDVVIKGEDPFAKKAADPGNDAYAKRDGQWLADWLGIDENVLKKVPNAGGTDQAEARAMNTALWPGTWGYYLDEMMRGVFSEQTIESTRQFFIKSVSGRGPVPAIRIGKQPYGILVSTAWSKMFSDSNAIRFEHDIRKTAPNDILFDKKLYSLLNKLDAEWASQVTNVSRVGIGKDPHKQLLESVSLHPGSVEFHQRYAQSFMQVYNQAVLQAGAFAGALVAGLFQLARKNTLEGLGINPELSVPILEKIFKDAAVPLVGPIIDDSDLSETKGIRGYTADNRNYIQWLAGSDFEDIRTMNFGAGKAEPNALLFLLLRHSLMLAFWDSSVKVVENTNRFTKDLLRKEPDFIHVTSAEKQEGLSKFEPLYHKDANITGDPNKTIGEYLLTPAMLKSREARVLAEVRSALHFLQDKPTARLERLLSEHVDLCTYRLDAWKAGLITERLENCRYKVNQAGELEKRNNGLYIGAYGWVLDLKPKDKELKPVKLNEKIFGDNFKDSTPLVSDSTNAGYLHAPSLSHAETATILKNAYLTHASEPEAETFAINLSSERVRKALSILEGVRNGQSLSALLGYMFERGLHDRSRSGGGSLHLDEFIYPMRMKWPLIEDTQDSSDPADVGSAKEHIEARNVIDGVALADHINKSSAKTYPFGVPIGVGKGQLPAADANHANAITQVAEEVLSAYDAVGDLLLAESVYQLTLGNFERSAASLNAVSQGKYPSEMQVANTPRKAFTLTHRVAIHLDPTVDSNVSNPSLTPRANANKALNKWISSLLPAPSSVRVKVIYEKPNSATKFYTTVSQADLGLQPIDLVYAAHLDQEKAMTELDERISRFVMDNAAHHPASSIQIDYTADVGPDAVSFFQLAPLLRSIREVVLKSRELRPTDLGLPNDQKSGSTTVDLIDLSRRTAMSIQLLKDHHDNLVKLFANLPPSADDRARATANAFLETAKFGIPQTSIGFIHEGISSLFSVVMKQVDAVVDRWEAKLLEYGKWLDNYQTLTNPTEQLVALASGERIVSGTSSDPTPTLAQIALQKENFEKQLNKFIQIQKTAWTNLGDFLTEVNNALQDYPSFESAWFNSDLQKNDISVTEKAVTTFIENLSDKLGQLIIDVDARVNAASKLISDASNASDGNQKQSLLQSAVKLVLGDDAMIIPRFKLEPDKGVEIDKCVSDSGQLLNYVTTVMDKKKSFPVDDWLYGVARVRQKLHAWENLTFLSEAFGAAKTPDLTPLQFPYRQKDSWMAMEFPDDYKIDSDKVLYTAHFDATFNKADLQCGLLVDEWTEVVPGKEDVTGVAFHFDAPNQEPPQALILAVTPHMVSKKSMESGKWTWDDLETTLLDTLDMAKKRLVGPQELDQSMYGQFLPATIMATTLHQITIATNLAANNNIYKKIRPYNG